MQSAVAIMGWPEILGVLIIILVMFGAKYIPDLLNGMRQGMHEFMKATRQVDRNVVDAWKIHAVEDDGRDAPRYGAKFWLIVALGVAAMCAAAVVLRELLQ